MKKKNFIKIIWVIFGVIVGYIGTILISDIRFNEKVRESTFNECFNYYSNIDKGTGIDTATIKLCKDKSEKI